MTDHEYPASPLLAGHVLYHRPEVDLARSRYRCGCGEAAWLYVPGTPSEAFAYIGHAHHVAQTWAQARTVSGDEAMEALPAGTVMVDEKGIPWEYAGPDIGFFTASQGRKAHPAPPVARIVYHPEDRPAEYR